jgi:hypothetical protein
MLVIVMAHVTLRKRFEGWMRKTRAKDSRIYFVELHDSELQDEWEKEVRGGESIWDQPSDTPMDVIIRRCTLIS